ncbi:integrase arm-type DNA-binding domain-containing protein [Roseomonas sp. E05]|uniref:tyrosine-type recombinase/integrase n=1 Tax=Roseomonas sp. E05 TaxID=3046310 RepID=UPI0024BBA44D|nr:integrase arm-type DNA-binding domain-containing protein [Roseomonas sp. E05]MDJ0391353.1 integrase arm-type DNA-binding domain-containing protein [Roseomonas sp. E05]
MKQIEALKPGPKPYRRSDGGGLLLEVHPSGAKVWLCRLTAAGKRRDMGLGGYPIVSLKAARAAARAAKEKAAAGLDPIGEKQGKAKALVAERHAQAEAEARTFRAVAQAYIRKEAPGWKHERTADFWQASLERYAFPVLGEMAVAEIGRDDVLRMIEEVWRDRPTVGKKVLQRTGAVLRYAAARGWRGGENPADTKTLRHLGLSALPGGKKQPSLPWTKLPAFMKALDAMPGLAALALRFAVLTALRSGEVRGVRWSELSFDGVPTLTVDGARMKGRKSVTLQPHRVPLPPAALDILARAYVRRTGANAKAADVPRLARLLTDALVFPNASGKAPLSDMALSAVMRRMNADRPEGAPPPWRDADGREAVPHGFRASFRTWVDDTRPGDAAAAEKALAHEDENTVAARYRRSDLFDLRVPLMVAWAEWCCGESSRSKVAAAEENTEAG